MKTTITWYLVGFFIVMVFFSFMPIAQEDNLLIVLNYLSLSAVFFTGITFANAKRSKYWWASVMAVILFTIACLTSTMRA